MRCWPCRPPCSVMTAGGRRAPPVGGQNSDGALCQALLGSQPLGRQAPDRDAPHHRRIRRKTYSRLGGGSGGCEDIPAPDILEPADRLVDQPQVTRPENIRYATYSLLGGWGGLSFPPAPRGGGLAYHPRPPHQPPRPPTKG